MRNKPAISRVSALLAVLAWVAPAEAQRPTTAPASAEALPFALLYDTATPADAALSAQELRARTGWKPVAEHDLKHAFMGDAVFMNDQLAVVLRRQGHAAEVYAQTGERAQRLAVLTAGGGQAPGSSKPPPVKIVENSSAAVCLEAGLAGGADDKSAVRLRLAAGAFFLEVRGGPDTGMLRIAQDARYLVVPDFFGDDLVLDPTSIEQPVVGLPTERSLLGLVDAGQAVVACVWPSPRQRAELRVELSGPRERRTANCALDLPSGQRVWIGLFRGRHIWHVRPMAPRDAGSAVALDWQAPFSAQWRASLVAADGSARSWNFAEAGAAGQPSAATSPESGCWFDAQRACVRIPSPAGGAPRPIVVYPIDRNRSTPLTTYCLTDLMRDALGVGPCQYVLDAEGLGTTEAATPAQVARWVQQQLEKKVARREPEAIREKLSLMVRLVQAVRERIEQYRRLGLRVRDICRQASAAESGGLATQMLAVAADMETATSASAPAAAAPTIENLAKQVAELAGQEDALRRSAEALARIRAIGARQDYELARLRMAVRRLNVLCPQGGGISNGDSVAAKVQKELQPVLPKGGAGSKSD